MKPSQKISLLQLLLALLCGVVMAVHRNVATSGRAQGIVAAVAAAVLILCGWYASHLRRKKSLAAPVPDKGCFGLLAAAGFLYLASAVGFAIQREAPSSLRLVCGLFACLCGAATLARLPSRDQSKTAGICAIVPVFFQSLYLLILYRSNADNPALGQFGYEIVAFSLALLGVYGACGGRFEAKRRTLHEVLCSLGLSFMTQELATALLQKDTFLAIPGISLGVLLMIPACGMLLASGLLYHREFEPDLVEAPRSQPPVSEASDEEADSENPSGE